MTLHIEGGKDPWGQGSFAGNHNIPSVAMHSLTMQMSEKDPDIYIQHEIYENNRERGWRGNMKLLFVLD